MYTRMTHGEDLCEVVQTMAAKYKMSEGGLYRDWTNRGDWGDWVIVEPTEEFVVQDYLQEMHEIEKNLWHIALYATLPDGEPDHKTRKDALAKLADIKLRKLEANQTLGRVHREPVKLQVQEHIDNLFEAIKAASGNDKKVQEKLIDALLIYERASQN